MNSTRIILVRHGETDWNATGRLQGHSDTPLNATGRLQAQQVARRLATEPVRGLYASDLARSFETAAIIGQAIHLPVVTSVRLRERRYGVWEGLTAAEIQARYPAEFAKWRARATDFAPPDGETIAELLSRALAELQAIGQQHSGETVVVVTHGGLCYVVLNHILGSVDGDRREFTFSNASMHTVGLSGEQWSVIAMNDTAHLRLTDG